MRYDSLALVGFVIRKRDIEYRRLVGVADIISARFINIGNLSIVDIPSYDFVKAFNEFNFSKEFKKNIVKGDSGYIIKAMGYLLIAGNIDLSCVNISKDNYNECYNINISLFDEDDNLVYPHYFNCDKEYKHSGYVCNLDSVYFKIDASTLKVEYSFKPFDLDKDNLIKLQTCNEFSGFDPYYLSKSVGDYGNIRTDFESIFSTVTDDILSVPYYVSKLSINKVGYIKNVSTIEIGNPNLEIMIFEKPEEAIKLIYGDYDIEKKLDIEISLSKIIVPKEVNADRIKNIVLGLYGINIRSLHKYEGDNTKLNNLKLADTKEEVISIIKSDFGIDIIER
jgi:hypothetical protein